MQYFWQRSTGKRKPYVQLSSAETISKVEFACTFLQSPVGTAVEARYPFGAGPFLFHFGAGPLG
jgi:hypothetical protein